MILPAFGIISEILPTFSRKPLFGATSMIYAIASIAFLSFIVWGHHMFVDGMPLAAQLFFMMSTMLIAVPTGREGVQLDRDDVEGFVVLRTAHAVCALVPVPVHHRRFLGRDARHRAGGLSIQPDLLRGGALPLRAGTRRGVRHHGRGVLLAAEVDRHMYSMGLAKTHFWLSTIFVNVLFFPQHFLGWPACRAASRTTPCNSPTGTWCPPSAASAFGLSQILFVIVIIQCARGGKKASARSLGWRHADRPRVDHSLAGAVSQLHGRPGDQMNSDQVPGRRVTASIALTALMSVALAFYFGFIVL